MRLLLLDIASDTSFKLSSDNSSSSSLSFLASICACNPGGNLPSSTCSSSSDDVSFSKKTSSVAYFDNESSILLTRRSGNPTESSTGSG